MMSSSRKRGTGVGPACNTVFILISMMIVSLALAFYNIQISQRLMDLERQTMNCVQSKNASSEEVQRLWEAYGQDLDTALLKVPDEAQDRIDEETRVESFIPDDILPPIDWAMPLPNTNIDIGVPVSGQDKKLVEFFRILGNAIEEFYRLTGSTTIVTIRAIVTRYSRDDASTSFQERLAKEAGLPKDRVMFAMTDEPKFHRAYAINVLHNTTKQDDKSVLAIVDVDMDVGPRFLHSSLAVVSESRFYFPIVFSQYRPSNTLLVEQFLGPQHKYSKHRGLWRDFGFGMYAVSGADAVSYRMDESFTGWGGEDNDFYKRVRDSPGIALVREREHDLVHRWHAKVCDLTGFVEPKKLRACVKSRNAMEGSNFGQFLIRLNASDSSIFRELLTSSRYFSQLVALLIESKLYGIHVKSHSKRSANLEVIQALASTEYEPGTASRLDEMLASTSAQEASQLKGPRAEGILIGVTASRETFSTRVAEIVQTWAKQLPKGVFVRFFVGDLVDTSVPYSTGSAEDIANLAKQAGISDHSTIVIMSGVQDDEYPLVQKAAAVLKYMDKAILKLKRVSKEHEVNWVFDVDDDTYVNVDGLQEFLGKRNFRQHTYIGQQGTGAKKDREMLRKSGLESPYCMGGTGILMAKETFQILVDNIQSCIQDAQRTQAVVYDDVVFGICLQRSIGVGCWDEKSYDRETFAHNFHGSNNFPRDSDLPKTITLHPHKTSGMMTRTHERFVRFVYNAKSFPLPQRLGFMSFLHQRDW